MGELFLCRFPRPKAAQRLICFPWAGGGAMFYAANWGKIIGEETEVVGLQLSGRETRTKVPLTEDFEAVIEESCSTIKTQFCDKPFAFWGHSMGALMAVIVGMRLIERHSIQPSCLFVSGMDAPKGTRKKHKMGASTKTEEEMEAWLERLGGTPKAILENPQLREVFVPVIKNDFLFMDNCQYTIDATNPPFTCPISIFDGADDYEKDLQGWKNLTHSSNFAVQTLPGGHFYLKDTNNTETIINHIRQRLKTCAFSLAGC